VAVLVTLTCWLSIPPTRILGKMIVVGVLMATVAGVAIVSSTLRVMVPPSDAE
jgi:predicted RND superfamily exporter protein